MPTLSNYTRNQIASLYRENLRPAEIFKLLKRENLEVSFASVTRIVNKLKLTGSTKKRTSTGRPRKLNAEARAFTEDQMWKDDETTSRAIQKKLARHGIMVHPSTVRRSRKQHGWTLQRTRYCQLIRDANKIKRLEFAQKVLETGDAFDNVIFTDECSISLEQFRRTCYRKVGEPAKRKPKPKHPLKLHVWAGISRHGGTKICIFEGIMVADLYCEILPNHRFMQDNDPKHTSRAAKAFFEENGINWWPTPPESPDLNPIENLWHELKYYLETTVKARSKQEMIDGIKMFWRKKVDATKCAKYIDHVLYKAIPAVVELRGAATKY